MGFSHSEDLDASSFSRVQQLGLASEPLLQLLEVPINPISEEKEEQQPLPESAQPS